MPPQQFLAELKSGVPGPLYLFVGPEMYRRRICRAQLLDRFLPAGEDRESAIARHDLDEVDLREVLDDAKSFSLFARRRVLLVAGAESALPRGNAKEEEQRLREMLHDYARNPSPDTVVVFDAHRTGFDNEGKSRLERLRKLFDSAIAVDFPPYTPEEARRLAAELASRRDLRFAPGVVEGLVEALGCDAPRIANEIEKLALFVNSARPVTADDVATLSPDAREGTIFALVHAMSRGDRKASLDILNTLVREGEYLPLALSFLAAQFRFALAAREEGLRSPQQIQTHFSRIGVAMWPARAQQVQQTLAAFGREALERAVGAVYEADKSFRGRSPDDRIVMERLILSLTAPTT